MTSSAPAMHPRNRHLNGYDFSYLVKQLPELAKWLLVNKAGDTSIDFSDAKAVKMLNQALLKSYYNVDFWDIPEGYLCPPIPGRVDYIHYLADLLADDNNGVIPTGKQIKVLDIGTGANLVYPLTGSFEYQWQFAGSDIDPVSIKMAKQLAQLNQRKITIRQQKNPEHIFTGIINDKDLFHLTLCNPPFHASAAAATQSSERKWHKLGVKPKSTLNFGGQHNELWCEGGEQQFITNMIEQSEQFSEQCIWFTSLVSKKETINALRVALKKLPVATVKVIEMAQGVKVSRFIAWSYFDEATRQEISQDFV
ncbi:MAG: 23S rRNA (adenine(1618)-N(6))-methyltransferase RlmF [Pseudoalteromonas sp.]|uniref:23S rRNA (adenine(1618)-N(6))-methyltransferase RlmF n=1 Tax=unclassified Pseudoalteromonas TaxID=194690 RepID=UPI003F950361